MPGTSDIVDCVPNAGGKRCIHCGWVWPRKGPFPRRNCSTFRKSSKLVKRFDDIPIDAGPGANLHKLLKTRLGAETELHCDCKKWIHRMNAWGPAECCKHIGQVVTALLGEAQRRKWKLDGRPLLSAAARIGTKTPWGMKYARRWARSLVEEAIEMAEKESATKLANSSNQQNDGDPKPVPQPNPEPPKPNNPSKAAVAKQRAKKARKAVEWAYGITTVPSRVDKLLPRTLASLAKGGFDRPRLFVDGENDLGKYGQFGLDVTIRDKIKMGGNHILALWELYLRQSHANYYALFEDDLITYKNLRQYLEQSQYPEKGYCNLYTFPHNQRRVSRDRVGWFETDQRGKGAVGLVFTRDAMTALLGCRFLAESPLGPKSCKSIDGVIVTALSKNSGWKEYTHNPSLVQHIGDKGQSALKHGSFPLAPSFRGEDFDALELLPETSAG